MDNFYIQFREVCGTICDISGEVHLSIYANRTIFCISLTENRFSTQSYIQNLMSDLGTDTGHRRTRSRQIVSQNEDDILLLLK
jgi:hypothetical protein